MHAVGRADLDVGQAGGGERRAELGLGQRAGDAARVGGHVRARGLVHALVGDHVGDREAPAGAQHARRLGEHALLVAREVDHAVGDHHVHGGVRERDVLEVALDELDVGDARLGRVRPREREHLVGHVEPDRLARRAHAPRADQHVGAGARAEVEHRLALVQVGDRGRHAAAQRRAERAGGRALRLAVGVQARAEHAGLVGAGDAAARARRLGRGRARGGGVLLPHRLADVRAGQVSHAVSSLVPSAETE